MSDRSVNRELLSEEVANQLLARAVALDGAHGSALTVDQLRDVARESGISERALEQALDEWNVTGVVSVPKAHALSAGGRLRGWLAEQLIAARRAVTGSPARNLLALAASWGVLMVLVSLDRANAVPWLVRKATDPIALGIGALIASRLRARPVALLLCGLAVAQGAEFVMDAALRTPAVQGFGSHLALMIAGVVGVLLGSVTTRRAGTAAASSESASTSAEAKQHMRGPLQRLRARMQPERLANGHRIASV